MTRDDNKLYCAFFSLLRAGLWDMMPDESYFPLGAADWEILYANAQKQTVEGIIYDGILKLPVACLPPHSLLLRWAVVVEWIERQNHRMNMAIGAQGRWFKEHDIDALLLKGQGVAAAYNCPSHRVCGDIDWYFPSLSDAVKAVRLLGEKGIRARWQAGFSASCQWGEFNVDCHTRMVDIHNPLCKTYLNRLIRVEESRRGVLVVGGETVSLPSPVLAQLLVDAHILKHMLAFGIGLRQLCDAARVCYYYRDKCKRAELEAAYRHLRIDRWGGQLYSLLMNVLGMPSSCLPFPLPPGVDARWMLEDVWATGNSGLSGQEDKKGRSKVMRRLWIHMRYVPSEVCWFPLAQSYSHLYKKIRIWHQG